VQTYKNYHPTGKTPIASERNISNNTRNGYYPKTIKGSHGEVEIFVPRDLPDDQSCVYYNNRT
jgi:hypothetical protein